jgi:hypothetical protein
MTKSGVGGSGGEITRARMLTSVPGVSFSSASNEVVVDLKRVWQAHV